jgi:hypothetical protein
MTIKQDALARAILDKKNIGKPLSEVANSVGYKSKQIYRKGTKQHLREYIEAKGISRDSLSTILANLGTQAQNKGDIGNALRSVELLSKLHGLIRGESNIVQVNTSAVLDSIKATDRAEVIGTVTDVDHVKP